MFLLYYLCCNARTAMQLQHVIKLKLSSQLIGQFGHVTASASCKQPEKHGIGSRIDWKRDHVRALNQQEGSCCQRIAVANAVLAYSVEVWG